MISRRSNIAPIRTILRSIPGSDERSGNTSGRSPKRTLNDRLVLAFAVTSLCALYGPFLLNHISYAFDRWSFADDARPQLFPFYRSGSSGLFMGDYIANYYLTAFSPILWKLLFQVVSTFADPVVFSKLLAYVLWIATMGFMAATSERLAGKLAAWGTLLIALPSPLYFDRMVGGLPRSFAFPFLALFMLCAVRGRIKLLFLLVPLAAGFYPIPAVVGGILLFGITLLPKRLHRDIGGDIAEWSIAKRSCALSLSALFVALLFLPQVIGGSKYGMRLDERHVAEFPEAGPQGRFGGSDRYPYINFFEGIKVFSKVSVLSRHDPFLEGLLNSDKAIPGIRRARIILLNGVMLISVLGLFLLIALKRLNTTPELLRFGLCAAVMGIAHTLAVVLAPNLFSPQRYLVFTIPLLIAVGLPSLIMLCIKAIDNGNEQTPSKSAQLTFAGVMSAFVLFFCGYPPQSGGYMTVDKNVRSLLEQIAQLPTDAVVAAWPKGVIDNVPLVSRRSALVNFETHQAFHADYVMEMRRRTKAVISAYFARGTIAPLQQLRNDFGVTHLLVDARHFNENRGNPKLRPSYFEPFNGEIPKRPADQRNEYEVLKLVPQAGIYSDGPYRLLDLAKLEAR